MGTPEYSHGAQCPRGLCTCHGKLRSAPQRSPCHPYARTPTAPLRPPHAFPTAFLMCSLEVVRMRNISWRTEDHRDWRNCGAERLGLFAHVHYRLEDQRSIEIGGLGAQSG